MDLSMNLGIFVLIKMKKRVPWLRISISESAFPVLGPNPSCHLQEKEISVEHESCDVSDMHYNLKAESTVSESLADCSFPDLGSSETVAVALNSTSNKSEVLVVDKNLKHPETYNISLNTSVAGIDNALDRCQELLLEQETEDNWQSTVALRMDEPVNHSRESVEQDSVWNTAI